LGAVRRAEAVEGCRPSVVKWVVERRANGFAPHPLAPLTWTPPPPPAVVVY
jgi:hypothetical protein